MSEEDMKDCEKAMIQRCNRIESKVEKLEESIKELINDYETVECPNTWKIKELMRALWIRDNISDATYKELSGGTEDSLYDKISELYDRATNGDIFDFSSLYIALAELLDKSQKEGTEEPPHDVPIVSPKEIQGFIESEIIEKRLQEQRLKFVEGLDKQIGIYQTYADNSLVREKKISILGIVKGLKMAKKQLDSEEAEK